MRSTDLRSHGPRLGRPNLHRLAFDQETFESFVGDKVKPEVMEVIRKNCGDNIERAVNMYFDGTWKNLLKTPVKAGATTWKSSPPIPALEIRSPANRSLVPAPCTPCRRPATLERLAWKAGRPEWYESAETWRRGQHRATEDRAVETSRRERSS